jgi:UDP-2,4-diacetamido-2,4,6-trideoxy-beta-L-altropyranose hydrolase
MKKADFLILTEAGRDIGYGHLSRCSAIQEFMKSKNINADLFVDLSEKLFAQGDFTVCNWKEFENNIFVRLYKYILFDSYLATSENIQILRQNCSKLIALDDYYRLNSEINIDLVINPNIFASQRLYQSRSVGGKDFIILRSPFRLDERKITIKQNITSILLTLGGSDYRDLLPKLIQNLSTLFPKFSLQVVAGNDNYMEEIKYKFSNHKSLNVYGFLDAHQMKDLMLCCDLAISGCGQTLHELAYLGLPTIGICIDKDQELNMLEYCKIGFLPRPILWNQEDFLKILNQIIYKYQKFSLRESISNIGYTTISSHGLENIFDAIYN